MSPDGERLTVLAAPQSNLRVTCPVPRPAVEEGGEDAEEDGLAELGFNSHGLTLHELQAANAK